MNDKIKLFNELAIKYAQESLNDIAIVNKSGIMYNYNDLYTEMFAQLIVKECALTAGLMEHEGRRGIGAQILDKFGVEE
jgi:hypothetical protein